MGTSGTKQNSNQLRDLAEITAAARGKEQANTVNHGSRHWKERYRYDTSDKLLPVDPRLV